MWYRSHNLQRFYDVFEHDYGPERQIGPTWVRTEQSEWKVNDSQWFSTQRFWQQRAGFSSQKAPPWSPLLAFSLLPLRNSKILRVKHHAQRKGSFTSNLKETTKKRTEEKRIGRVGNNLIYRDIWTSCVLTGGASIEVVVVLRDVGKNAQPVWDPQSHHVFCI